MKDGDFEKLMEGAGFDLEEARQQAEAIERDQIRKEIFDVIDQHHISTPLAYGEYEAQGRLAAYYMNLIDNWYMRIGLEASRHGRFDISDEEFDRMAEERAAEELKKYYGFHKKIVDGLEEIIYRIRHTGMSDTENYKNLYLAITFVENGIDVGDPKVQPFVDLFDFMVPGELYNPDSIECLRNIITAQELANAPGDLDAIEDADE